eukprot:jgi/Pico_ML_1/55510/g1185.t1
MPKARPNSMNQYGILLEELGLYPGLLDPLLKEYLQPMARVLFPDAAGDTLDHHRSFIVEYQMDKDRELAYHYDDAEVTLNVCIGGNFDGGELLFGNLKSSKGPDFERSKKKSFPSFSACILCFRSCSCRAFFSASALALAAFLSSSSFFLIFFLHDGINFFSLSPLPFLIDPNSLLFFLDGFLVLLFPSFRFSCFSGCQQFQFFLGIGWTF